MDRIHKFLKSLSPGREKKINKLINNITKDNLTKLDCKKLHGVLNIYRVRSGDIRILFQKSKTNGNVIISIESRRENTYKNL